MNSSQVRGGALHAAADHPLVVLLELRDQGRKIAVAGKQGEDVDVMLGVAEVQRVDHHVDVGAVLAAGLALGNVDQLDAVGMELANGVAVVAPVAICPLVDDSPFFQQPLQHQRDLERLGLHFADAEGQVFEIDKDGDQGFVGHGVTQRFPSFAAMRGVFPCQGRQGADKAIHGTDPSIVAATPARRKGVANRGVASALLPPEEETIATQGQPDRPRGPADSAGVAVIAAARRSRDGRTRILSVRTSRFWTAAG